MSVGGRRFAHGRDHVQPQVGCVGTRNSCWNLPRQPGRPNTRTLSLSLPLSLSPFFSSLSVFVEPAGQMAMATGAAGIKYMLSEDIPGNRARKPNNLIFN